MVVNLLTTAALVVLSIVGVVWGLRFAVALANEKTANTAFDESNRLVSAMAGGVAGLFVIGLTYSAEIIDVGTQLMAEHAMAISNAVIGTLGYVGLSGLVEMDPLVYVGIVAVVIVAVAFAREVRTA